MIMALGEPVPFPSLFLVSSMNFVVIVRCSEDFHFPKYGESEDAFDYDIDDLLRQVRIS